MSLPNDVSDLGTNLAQLCFAYPQQTTGRKHGPQGYTNYESYRDWLRDEFSYRCAYCLMRETWLRGERGFQIDHCIPQFLDETLRLEYDNLVYTCPWCNLAKSGVPVPNPTEIAYGEALEVDVEGVMKARNELGRALIAGLRLDHPDITRHRRTVLQVIQLAEHKNNVEIILRLLGFPEDLPNLKQKRPPKGNTRPEGVSNSCYEKQHRGELALIY